MDSYPAKGGLRIFYTDSEIAIFPVLNGSADIRRYRCSAQVVKDFSVFKVLPQFLLIKAASVLPYDRRCRGILLL